MKSKNTSNLSTEMERRAKKTLALKESQAKHPFFKEKSPFRLSNWEITLVLLEVELYFLSHSGMLKSLGFDEATFFHEFANEGEGLGLTAKVEAVMERIAIKRQRKNLDESISKTPTPIQGVKRL